MARESARSAGDAVGTYTAVLLSNSAVPVWLATRKSLPFLFGASSGASLASVLDLMPLDERERAIVKCFGIAGRTAEVVAGEFAEMDRDAQCRSDGRYARVSRVAMESGQGPDCIESGVDSHSRKERGLAPDGGSMRHSGQHGPAIRHFPSR